MKQIQKKKEKKTTYNSICFLPTRLMLFFFSIFFPTQKFEHLFFYHFSDKCFARNGNKQQIWKMKLPSDFTSLPFFSVVHFMNRKMCDKTENKYMTKRAYKVNKHLS